MFDENFINSVLLDWALKSPDGMLLESLTEENLQVLCESLVSNGLSEADSINIVNDMVVIAEKGKHPERQAWNANGILVTFPTPEYKARALSRGTHFEKDPRVAQSNLFGGGQTAPNQPTPNVAPAAGGEMDTKQSALPASDTSQQQTPPAQKEIPEPGTPGTPAPPSSAPPSAPASSTQTPAQGQLAVEPTPQTPAAPNVAPPAAPPTPPAVQKTPQEIETEKEVIKSMLNTDDTLPTVPGVGGSGITEDKLTEQLNKLTKIALEMNLNEAVKFLSKHI
jgi:hypothetical protein